MRVLIESRKLTIELATTKQLVADKPVANTFATETLIENPKISRLDKECDSCSTNEQYSVIETDTSVSRRTQLPRRKSTRKRIGRLFLRISRMCSESQYSICAHQHGGAATELPAGGSATDETTSFYEMPGSLSPVELEQPVTEPPGIQRPFISRTCPLAAPEHLRSYYKSNENAMLRRNAPLSVTNLPQLHRLEVPQSQNSVPRLMSDHSPLTPSPISPYTPAIEANSSHIQNLSSQLYLNAVSPCKSPSQGQIFAHYGSWSTQTQLSPATPSTVTSHGSSHATTPLSSHPSSACSSFQSWPQLQSQKMPPTYTHIEPSLDYNPRMNDPSAVGTILWPVHGFLHPYDYSTSMTEPQMHDLSSDLRLATTSYDGSLQPRSCYDKHNRSYTPQSQPTFTQSGFTFDAPPAYDPVAPDPYRYIPISPQRHPPSVCQHCGKVFTGKYSTGNCKRHVRQAHETILDRMKNMCNVCKKTYNRADALRKHGWKKHRLEQYRPNKRRRDD